MNNSLSTNNIEPHSIDLITSIKEKNSRNLERFSGDAITGSILETKGSSTQYALTSDQAKSDSHTQSMSFDVKQNQRLFKPQKKDEEKVLLNFEDMKRKILKDYIKNSNKEVSSLMTQPGHQGKDTKITPNYLTNDASKKKDFLSDFKYAKEEEYPSGTNNLSSKKKSSKRSSNKSQFLAIYDGGLIGPWSNHQPLAQKQMNIGDVSSSKETRATKGTPSKKHHSKSSSK